MKLLITCGVLLLSFGSYSQTSVKSQPNSVKIYGAASLNQFIWSYSKNKPGPGEKALVDFNTINDWRQIGHYLSVSDDGKYFAYTTKKPSGKEYWYRRQDSLVIQSTRSTWRQAFVTKAQGFFAADSKQYIFQNGSDLFFIPLGGTQPKIVKDIAGYQVFQNKWMAYQLKGKDSLALQNLATLNEKLFEGIKSYAFNNSGDWLVGETAGKELLLYDLGTGTEKHFSNVDSYSFSENGKVLVIKAFDQNGIRLQYENLLRPNSKIIWTNTSKCSVSNLSMDALGKQVLFDVVDSVDVDNSGIWYCREGMDKAILKISKQTINIPGGLRISNASFSDNGRYIRLSLQTKLEKPAELTDDMVGVDVWNHKDLNLQSLQPDLLQQTKEYTGIVNIEDGQLAYLENDNKKISLLQGDFMIVKTDYKNAIGDRFWETVNQDSTWVVNLKNGSSNLIATGQRTQYWFSPSGNYLVYFDASKGCQYFSYDLRSGISINMTANLPKNKLGQFSRYKGNAETPDNVNPPVWMEKDEGLLVYDNYDIWKLDLNGKPAVNITNGFGNANSIKFQLLSFSNSSFGKTSGSIILQAYNVNNKQSGFYRKTLNEIGNPELLSMGKYFINWVQGWQQIDLSNEFEPHPSKAKNLDYWIIQRQSESDASNYFETTDFKNFKRLTNDQPQKGYQWLTEELVSFKHLDGKTGQGILFKPENFDPAKKYPVLIVFYGAFSDNMYQFRSPDFINQSIEPGISPIWFLNNGYLVFTPDIYVEPTKYGPKAYSVIEGAVQYLKTLPYVNGDKLGCATHSWSGKLGAYLFTHSKSIAASSISEGFLYADIINHALSPKANGSLLWDVEVQMEYGSLWQNKEAWLDQTTVLNVDKAKGPLLLFCNKGSTPDYQDQTFQFFTALRRLEKNVWWLKYDNGDHTVYDIKDRMDYTIRYTQFFDHYLKNAPAPMWMTQGIPYKLKGIESRYELDPQGTCNSPNGEPCPICEAWNKQYKRTPEMFTKPIAEWVLDKDIADVLRQAQDEKRNELDKEGEVMNKKILDILKNGYPEDEKNKMKSEVGSQK